MDPSSHLADSDDHPHPKLVDIVGVFIALLTLTFPMSMVFRYAPSVSPGVGLVAPNAEATTLPSMPWRIDSR